ncbi:MAG: hypothetical protein JWN40_1560 [Phycisphaerales bacterium]|nr:hypothetical protein [Phycisphaerales bacterium]
MAVQLSKKSFDFAKKLIDDGEFVYDQRDDWSEHQPTAEDENEFIRRHGWDEYANWHLGKDDEHPEQTKGHFKFPYGDFRKLHRCAVISAESRAGQYKYLNIEEAAKRLLAMLEQVPH